MVPIATGCSLSANGISVSMVTGCTRANLRRVCGSCTSCFLHRNDQPTTSAHEHPPPPRVTEQVLLGAQVTQVNIDVGTLCTSVTEGGDWLGGRDEENQSSSLYFFCCCCCCFCFCPPWSHLQECLWSDVSLCEESVRLLAGP